ncbi:MAG: hypothetical protein RL127_390 [Bacteroidota bacterium]
MKTTDGNLWGVDLGGTRSTRSDARDRSQTNRYGGI